MMLVSDVMWSDLGSIKYNTLRARLESCGIRIIIILID
jgi:hypothetical protein